MSVCTRVYVSVWCERACIVCRRMVREYTCVVRGRGQGISIISLFPVNHSYLFSSFPSTVHHSVCMCLVCVCMHVEPKLIS